MARDRTVGSTATSNISIRTDQFRRHQTADPRPLHCESVVRSYLRPGSFEVFLVAAFRSPQATSQSLSMLLGKDAPERSGARPSVGDEVRSAGSRDLEHQVVLRCAATYVA
jgi:hypothetical protein